MTDATPAPKTQQQGVPARDAGFQGRDNNRRSGGAPQTGGASRGGDHSQRRPSRRPREPRARSEFDNKLIDIRRVTRVVAGGRRFSFSVTIVIGNGRGKVGVGLGKASDTALAIEKATKNAQRHLVTVPITDEGSIPHEVSAKYAAAQVILLPAPRKGLKAGSAMRTVLELAGLRNVSGKVISRSKNPLNNAKATSLALSKLKLVRHKVAKVSTEAVKQESVVKKSD
ncbi:MAG: 30S ribosomal protein S5 [Candidatus Pacebacteria bacterium]|nr:30S ribosomal protein S5 [Candidatus Paceibacterota bacterium]